MNIHVGSFCAPTIRTLMQRVQETQRTLHQNVPDSPLWDVANRADNEACEDLYLGLMVATGLTRDELRQLGEAI